jgi:cyanophycinase
MLKQLCSALVLALACAGALAADPAKGSLVIIGGALRQDNAPVWQKIVDLAGGKGARIAVIPSAAEHPEKEGKAVAEQLNRFGAQAFVVPMAPRWPGTDARKVADDPALAAAVRSAGGAFIVGGDQARITGTLRHADGSNTAVLDAMWTMYRRGGVIAGTSAGAAVMSSTMFYDPPPIMAMLKEGVVEGRDVAPGLGFVGDGVFVDQHLLARGRFARMLAVMLARHYTLGLGIDENTAAVVGPTREVSVVGYRGALILDLSQASTDKAQPRFNLSNARISYLDSGDRFDLKSHAYFPGPDKERVDRSNPEWRGTIFYPDILGNTAVVNLLEKLADGDQVRAVGIAFDGPASKAPEQGFEFTFTLVPDSEGYVSMHAETWSVYRVRMDVRPMHMQQPLYTTE